MATSTSTFQITEGAEPFPGYTLQERIGSGGYGEVWRATAPGGLRKAIKFVFGRLQDKRAERELKSLDRIKGLNHPFLLTLERIECVDGHLAIVTELAEGSLRERFESCRAAGDLGIPRDELQEYMREAADALDYLVKYHALQHLDVKPENMLLIGNHVKVADFGLLKDLQQVTASLVSGLTPRYASPELFDGRPTQYSDQYSLAVAYQELATGVLPFAGTTAATLAAQHLRAAPDLSELTPLERFAVGKALAKDPTRRFPSSSEFVRRLTYRSRAGTAIMATGACATNQAGLRDGNDYSVPWAPHAHGENPGAADATDSHHDGQTIDFAELDFIALPPIDLSQIEAIYRPTVFIGVGGVGGEVLRRIRQMINDRFGDTAPVESLQLLYIDTDVDAINEATSVAGSGQLRPCEAIAAPIRETWDYRERPVARVPSLSRRWIYNIPRSRKTEGLRALGRLAFLDHSKQILEALRSAILTATNKEAIQATAEMTGLPFQEIDPRVYLIASLEGGAGGGMFIDLGYAVRQILAETGFADAGLCGILFCSAHGEFREGSLGPANTFACLEELLYFSLPGNDYPGESYCGLAGFREATPTFPNSYLIGTGPAHATEGFDKILDQTATYLLHTSVSSAMAFTDACRQTDEEAASESLLAFRTAGTTSLGVENWSVRPEWIESVCHSLVQLWQDGLDAIEEARIRLSDQERLSEACHSVCAEDVLPQDLLIQCEEKVGFEATEFVARLGDVLERELGGDVVSYLNTLLTDLIRATQIHDEADLTPAFRKLHSVVGIEEDAEAELSRQIESLGEIGCDEIREYSKTIGSAIDAWLFRLVDDPQIRLAGARRVADWISARINSLLSDTQRKLRHATEIRTAFKQHIFESYTIPKYRKRELGTDCRRYVELLIEEFTLDNQCKAICRIRSQVTVSSDRLRDLSREFNQLADTFRPSLTRSSEATGKEPASADAAALAPPLEEIIADHIPEMIDLLDREVTAGFFRPGESLRDVLASTDGRRAELVEQMRVGARRAILQIANRVMMDHLQDALAESDCNRASGLVQGGVEAATPQLTKVAGGGRRLLLVAPEECEADTIRTKLEQVSGDMVSVTHHDAGDVRIIYEVEGLSIESIKACLLRSRPDCEEVAHRLRTRIDVDW